MPQLEDGQQPVERGVVDREVEQQAEQVASLVGAGHVAGLVLDQQQVGIDADRRRQSRFDGQRGGPEAGAGDRGDGVVERAHE